MIDSWFEIENGVPVLSREARNISCLLKLITRDKVPTTTVDGKTARVKVKSRKEIAFIYYVLKTDEFSNYSGKERIEIIKKRLDIDFEIDKQVWDAIDELKEDLVTIEEKLLKNFTETLYGYVTFLGKIGERVQANIEFLERPVENMTLSDIQEVDRILDKRKEDFKWILDASNQLKTTFKNIEELKVVKNVKGRKKKADRLQTDVDLYRRREDV